MIFSVFRPLLAVIFLSTLSACTPSEPVKSGGTPRKEHHGKGHHKHEFTGAIKEFHDVLAPVYHMEKSPARVDKSCEGVAAMKAAASKIPAEPKGDPVVWKSRAEALSQSVDALDSSCQVEGRPEVQAKLEVLHDAFHALMEAEQKK